MIRLQSSNQPQSHISRWPQTGAIFCGCKSSHIGQPKEAILFPSGITLIEHVYRALKAVCREVVLVGHGEDIPESLRSLKRISDNHKGLGPVENSTLHSIPEQYGLELSNTNIPEDLGV